MRRAPVVLVLVALVVLGVGASCGEDGGPGVSSGGDRLTVLASFYPLAEAAAVVGGDVVEVGNITPAGVEPHDLELTPDEVDVLEDADLVVYLGGGFQPAVQAVAERRDGATLDLLEGVEPAGEIGEDEVVDPHFWLDPVRYAEASERIEQMLVRLAPASAETLRANGRAFRDGLTALDAEFRSGLASCPRRDVVTAHEAFHFLAERYGLTEHAIAGLSPEAEPDAARLADLTALIKELGVTTVFYESLASPRVAETLAREAGVEAAVLNPIEGRTVEEVDAGKDYADSMRDNLAALRAALGCP